MVSGDSLEATMLGAGCFVDSGPYSLATSTYVSWVSFGIGCSQACLFESLPQRFLWILNPVG
jgi:hypothetical protein